MLPILRIGPFALPTASLVYLLAFYVGLEIAERAARREGVRPELVSNAAWLALGAGIIGARVGFVVEHFAAYQNDFSQALALSIQTLDPNLGILIGVGAAAFYLADRDVPWGKLLDAIAPALALNLAAISFGNFLSGDAYGAPAAGLPWAVYLWGEYRHPTQVYELLAYLAIFGLVWRARQHTPFSGFRFALSIALLAAMRLFLEAFRGDSIIVAGGWRQAQIMAFVVLAIALFAINRRFEHAGKKIRASLPANQQRLHRKTRAERE